MLWIIHRRGILARRHWALLILFVRMNLCRISINQKIKHPYSFELNIRPFAITAVTQKSCNKLKRTHGNAWTLTFSAARRRYFVNLFVYVEMKATLVYTGWLHQKNESISYSFSHFHISTAPHSQRLKSVRALETMTRPNIKANIENCYCEKRKIRESFVLAHSLRPHIVHCVARDRPENRYFSSLPNSVRFAGHRHTRKGRL